MLNNQLPKAELQAILEKMYAETVEEKGADAVTLYAPVLPVTRRPWKPKPVDAVDAFQEEIQRLAAEKQQNESQPKAEENQATISLDEFPGLLEAAKSFRRSRHKKH